MAAGFSSRGFKATWACRQRVAGGLSAGLILVVGLAASSPVVQGRIITVCPDGSGEFTLIGEAIGAAVDGDEIVLCDGIYTGFGNKNLDFLGKAITLRSASDDPAACVIDCEQDGRGFIFQRGEGADTIVRGITVRNGLVEDKGGGAVVFQSSPTFIRCVFENNTAQDTTGSGSVSGGGMDLEEAGPTLIGCTFTANRASVSSFDFTADGGGIAVRANSTPILVGCMFSGNSADRGGGISIGAGSVATVYDSTFTSNFAPGGGGAIVDLQGSLIAVRSSFTENSARDEGGGGGTLSRGTAIFANCVFAGNSTCCDIFAYGAGIAASGPVPVDIINTLFSGNEIQGEGAHGAGVLAREDVDLKVIGCTFSGNTTGLGHGGAVVKYEGGLPGILVNNIFWGNTDTPISGNLSVRYCDVEGGYAGPGNIDADPLFVDPDGPDNDPRTWQDNDYRLGAGSPCIDAGDNTSVPADTLDLDEDGDTSEPVPIDLDGNPRFVDDPTSPDTGNGSAPIVDMGAYEFQAQGIPGDFDGDGDVDIADFSFFVTCFGGSGVPCSGQCCAADLDGDRDVDIADFAIFTTNFTGSQ